MLFERELTQCYDGATDKITGELFTTYGEEPDIAVGAGGTVSADSVPYLSD